MLDFSTNHLTEFDNEGIVCLQTFLGGDLEIYQPAIPSWPGPDLITSSWIFSHKTYVDWLDHAEPAILCLCGKPGSGKSVLSSLVIRNLRLSTTGGEKRAIVFFFCNEQDERRHSTRDLLSSLIHQLLVQQPSLFNRVRSLWALKTDKSHWTRSELRVLFRAIIHSREMVQLVCIIDGLDKCDASHLELWEDLVDATNIHQAPVIAAILSTDPGDDSLDNAEAEATTIPTITESSLKFMITTRSALETHTPRGSSFFSIDIETQGGVRDDMVSLLTVGVKDLVQKRPGFSGFEEIISTKLLSAPDATILTVSLGLGELETIMVSSAPVSVQKKLKSISFTLDEIYARHLQSVSADWHGWAHDVLLWVIYAVRPLTVHELALALAIKQEHKCLTAVAGSISQDLPGDIERVFHGLIIIKHDEVHLADPTIKEFILRDSSVYHQYWYPTYSSGDPHCRIARTCLTYLSMNNFEHVSSLDEVDGDCPLPESQRGFLAYAAHHWYKHYRLVREEESGMASDVLSFLTEQVQANGLYWSIPGSNLGGVQWESILHIAAALGFRDVVLNILGKTASDEQVTKAFEWAAKSGHNILVKRLLEGPEYHLEIGPDSTAMRSAAGSGHGSIVKLLLEHETKTDSPSANGSGALPSAAQGGHTEVVKILLELGVDLATRSTALHLAGLGGNESVVKLLLVAGDIDLEEKWAENDLPPLQVAALRGYLGIVKLLLAHGASTQSLGYNELTPLHFAARNGHLNIANQLLKAGADIDPSDKNNYTPLHHACQQGHATTVDYLLDAGADGELTTKFKETPLYLAVKRGHTEVMEQLLDYGAEVNTKSRDGWTALHLAVRDGLLDAVKLLLEAGADVDAKTGKGSTPLFLASELGNVAITKYLLGNGANPRQTNKTQSTPLHRASQKGNLGVVKLLLAADADPLAEKDNGDTPLGLARIEGHSTIVAELDINHQDEDGRTKLFHACSGGVLGDIKKLLLAKADPTIKDNDGRLPLDMLLYPATRLVFLNIVAGAAETEAKTLDGRHHCARPSGNWSYTCDVCRNYIFEVSPDGHIVKGIPVFYYRESLSFFISGPFIELGAD